MASQKGFAGNPLGRRKERIFYNALIVELNTSPDDKRSIRAIAAKLICLGIEGNIHAIKEIANRLDGLPKATVDLGIDRHSNVMEMTDEQLLEVIGDQPENGRKH